MTAALMPPGDPTVMVASTALALGLHQGRMGSTLVQVRMNHPNDEASSCRGRFSLYESHDV